MKADHRVPVVLVLFNRPEETRRVFAAIRAARPSWLFVIADGPRSGVPGEADRCAEALAVVDSVDWECDVRSSVSPTNLGCRDRVTSGLDWVFSEVDRAIILEDDCLPDPTFFRFCEDLLEHYADNPQVMSIAGTNQQFGRRRGPYSYYFSMYEACWGWATWRRAWDRNDPQLATWPRAKEEGVLDFIFSSPSVRKSWFRILSKVYRGEINSWAYKWTYAHLIHSGLSIIPNVNLVSNIGFGPEATHTQGVSRLANMPAVPMAFPLDHPPYVVRHRVADEFLESLTVPPEWRRIAGRVRRGARHVLTRATGGDQ